MTDKPVNHSADDTRAHGSALKLHLFPRHVILEIGHNEYKGMYETVAEWLAERNITIDDWASAEQRDKSLETNELWEMSWYPDSPVGFCCLLAADLDALLTESARIAREESQ